MFSKIILLSVFSFSLAALSADATDPTDALMPDTVQSINGVYQKSVDDYRAKSPAFFKLDSDARALSKQLDEARGNLEAVQQQLARDIVNSADAGIIEKEKAAIARITTQIQQDTDKLHGEMGLEAQ